MGSDFMSPSSPSSSSRIASLSTTRLGIGIDDDNDRSQLSTQQQVVKPLSWLLRELKTNNGRALLRRMSKLIGKPSVASSNAGCCSVNSDASEIDDKCYHVPARQRVLFQGTQWATARLIYTLCTPTRDVDLIGRLTTTCAARSGFHCVNPLHQKCHTPHEPPKRNVYGNTPLTEMILRRHFPDYVRQRSARRRRLIRRAAAVMNRLGMRRKREPDKSSNVDADDDDGEGDEDQEPVCMTYKRPRVDDLDAADHIFDTVFTPRVLMPAIAQILSAAE